MGDMFQKLDDLDLPKLLKLCILSMNGDSECHSFDSDDFTELFIFWQDPDVEIRLQGEARDTFKRCLKSEWIVPLASRYLEQGTMLMRGMYRDIHNKRLMHTNKYICAVFLALCEDVFQSEVTFYTEEIEKHVKPRLKHAKRFSNSMFNKYRKR